MLSGEPSFPFRVRDPWPVALRIAAKLKTKCIISATWLYPSTKLTRDEFLSWLKRYTHQIRAPGSVQSALKFETNCCAIAFQDCSFDTSLTVLPVTFPQDWRFRVAIEKIYLAQGEYSIAFAWSAFLSSSWLHVGDVFSRLAHFIKGKDKWQIFFRLLLWCRYLQHANPAEKWCKTSHLVSTATAA